ncbi:MAG TPA: ribosome small subunit-dependent GTPase A [Lachnospiraceae bacterium]|nr:ribosome small subunit-dependent GTPase A [Lachnospiraceae bacterium]
MRGRIIRGIGGFYYVATEDAGIYACKARGIFRLLKTKPLVGDWVDISVTHEKDKEASITQIFPRKNELIRPAAANVDQAMVLFAVKDPDPDGVLIDRFLTMMKMQSVPAFICFNKLDLAGEDTIAHWKNVYRNSGYEILFCSAENNIGIEQLREKLQGKTTVIAGPSGAGKSSVTNLLQDHVMMETGEISKKLGRGRHTTRHAELIMLNGESYLCDTPGFTSLFLPDMKKEELETCFPEIDRYADQCRFVGCSHTAEPDCAVKNALREGKISKERYHNYVMIYRELEEKEKRRY